MSTPARLCPRGNVAAWLVLFAALGLAGCAETHLYSGRPPGEAAAGFDERWHSAFLLGTTDNGRPYRLDSACPGGWSEIVLSQDTFTVLLSAATLFLYTPSRITIVCAKDSDSARADQAMHTYPPKASDFDD